MIAVCGKVTAALDAVRREQADLRQEIEKLKAQLVFMVEVNGALVHPCYADANLKQENADLRRQLAEQVVISQKLWAELTPQKRDELNLSSLEVK